MLCVPSMSLLGNLDYSDDTAMARCVVQSILTRAGFDERDMAHRYANESAHCCKLQSCFDGSDRKRKYQSAINLFGPT